MKKFTLHFLIIALISGILGFTGLDFPGATAVRVICLFSAIALMISCLDSLIISRKQKKIEKKQAPLKVKG